jgi:NAD(P)-dependent dehydrogenase (short-subunit alcohol dehydrogenase family)
MDDFSAEFLHFGPFQPMQKVTTSSCMFSLANKTALVTGAGSGIGRAIACLFARAGAHVWVTDLPTPQGIAAGKETVALIQAHQGHAEFTSLDVSDPAAFAQAYSVVPEVDVLVCNAGIGHVGTVLTTTADDLDRVLRINVRGVFLTMKTWLPGMIDRRRGAIINLASTAGLEGLVDRLAYSTSKHAVVGLTRSAALDHALSGVRINCICPGRVATPFVEARLKEYPDPDAAYREMCSTQPQGRMGSPDEIASAALYLASDEASYVTGIALSVDGGWTAGMFPKPTMS